MPMYNAGNYLHESITSILNQTFTDFELIIVDDGSTDHSLAIIKEYAEKDQRIRWITTKHAGIAHASIVLVKASLGKYIARMGADDISLPERLEKEVAYMETHPECVSIGSSSLLIDPDGSPLTIFQAIENHEDIIHEHSQGRYAMSDTSVLIRKLAIEKAGGYSESVFLAEDYDLNLRLEEIGKLHNLPDVLVKYRQHIGSICNKNYDLLRDTTYQSLVTAYKRRGKKIPQELNKELTKKFTKVSVPEAYRKWGWWALGYGNIPTARKYAFKSFISNPLSLDNWRLLYCTLRGY